MCSVSGRPTLGRRRWLEKKLQAGEEGAESDGRESRFEDGHKLGCVPTPISRAEVESSLERKVGYTREMKRLPSRCDKLYDHRNACRGRNED